MRRLVLYISFMFLAISVFAQSQKKYVRQGNKDYANENYEDAEISYRKSLEKESNYSTAQYNLGAALYKQKKYDEAGESFKSLTINEGDKEKAAKYYYNLGNTLMQTQKVKEAVEAYKRSLMLNPKDMEAKYNLSYALKMMKNQQQNQQNKDNKPPPEPSEYAKKLKEQAEALVARREYEEAYNLMIEGEKIDPTVAVFKDFTQRINDVIEIKSM